MSLDNRPEDAPEIDGIDALVDGLRAAETPRERFRVGMEHEKIGLLEEDLSPVPYHGDRSIATVLRLLSERRGFTPYYEGDHVIALTKAGTAISLEPGGQLELSGAVLESNHQTCRELTEHRDFTRTIGDELGILWLGVGHTPFARRDEIFWVPKARYGIMKRYLPARGDRALDMMLRTGTVQANYDWSDEADMVRKMRAATAVTSLVSAIYANAAIVEGEVTGWVSERQRSWLSVDPDRCGLPTFVFDEDFGYRRWVEWALDVPMFFIRREGRYVEGVAGMPFRTFLEKGFEGMRARISDWEDHLTTLFPEVRLKAYLEVRGADCCDRDLNCALPALWKGLLYDDEATDAALALTRSWSLEGRRQLVADVARLGLGASVDGHRVLDLCRELVEIAREGLASQRALNDLGEDETKFLGPIDRLLDGGKSPGQIAAEKWTGALGRDPRKLAEHYRF
jgi:glutamate--cysteine ligase